MFELHDVSLLAAATPRERILLGDVSAVFPPGELTAVSGPPGSGKSLLLQVLAGVREPTFGEVVWSGASPRPAVAYRPPLALKPGRLERWLTPAEQVAAALRLRGAGASRAEVSAQTAVLLEKTGLTGVAGTRALELPRGMRRRLELAVHLAGSPGLLLWDEAGAEAGRKFDELLRELAAELRLAIVRVAEAPERLENFDAVLVLAGGQLAYHGPPICLDHYFQIDAPRMLYGRLAERSPEEWRQSWVKHGAAYRDGSQAQFPVPVSTPSGGDEETSAGTGAGRGETVPRPLPGLAAQCRELLWLRCRLTFRGGATLGRSLAFLLGAPLAVTVFAMGGVPRFAGLAARLRGDVLARIKTDASLAADAAFGVRLLMGLVFAQLLLLAFLAARDASHEIAGERHFLESAKFRGLRPGAFLLSQTAFTLSRAVLQALWMGTYVHWVCRLPGALGWQLGALALANAAFACLCLAVSGFAQTPGRSRRFCYGWAALQLPFAGVLLAPPDWLAWMLRPLSPLYWGAGTYLESLAGTRFDEVFQMLEPSSPAGLCLGMLVLQGALGLGMAFTGCHVGRLKIACRHSGT